ncbi:MAG: exodeoxyribonuclease V subunit gamma [Phycisphaerae bacterium]|nr:exodeoxyribonuclease V subunit gamma [Phycisphaerae bacterium]
MEGVQFILGRSGTGKTRWCLDAVCDALQTGGNEPLILLVPEQATYQAERAILSHPDIAGFSRLRILSFDRLQFWLDSGPASGAEISRTGKQMVLQKLLGELSDKLSLYRGSQQRSGLAEKLSSLFTEFQQADCTPEQMQALAATLAGKRGEEIAAAKWADIALLFEHYLGFFHANEGGFSNPDVGLKEAAGKVAQAEFLKNATLWVDGFSGFSVQERDLLIELIKVSKATHIALCLDPKRIDLSNTDAEKLDPFSLFQATEQTYTDLLRILGGYKFSIKPPIILDRPRRFENAPPLAFLEANLFDADTTGNARGAANIRIASCSHVRTETVWVARVIRKLVKERAMRYRDIAVVVPDINTYAHYIESAFAQYGLPYFLDRPRTMKNHPVAAMIGAALQAAANEFGLSDVLSFLKSDLTGIEAEAIDMLENYCRAFDVQKNEWTGNEPWDFAPADEKKRYDEKQLDTLRRKAIAPLQHLRQNLYAQKDITAGQFAQAIWGLLEELNVQETLAGWSATDASDQVYGHRQLFAKLVELLDEMCAIFAGQEMAAELWRSVFSDALSTLTIKLIPPTLDQVLVGSIERSRHPSIKAIFLVGATQKQFPVPLGQENLLAEADYAFAAGQAMELADPYQSQLVHRQYLTYIAMTRASKYLFISHPMLDEKGSAIVPWSGIEQLMSVFADVRPVYPQGLADGPETIATEAELAQWLCAAMGKDRVTGSRQKAEGGDEEIAAGVLEQMGGCGHEGLQEIGRHVSGALSYDNAAGLDGKLTKALFEMPMRTSVTRLGMFAACPYQHFARYVLRLEKRVLLRFEPMDVGTFYHAVLEAMFHALEAEKKDWADATEDELAAVCERTIETFLQNDTHIANFIRRNAHHRYIIEAAGQTLKDFMPTLRQLSAAGVFKQTDAELEFGPNKEIQLAIEKDGKPFVQFAGKIDRLDVAEINGKPVSVVFDFKRTSRSANFTKMLYGLDLQLPVYLLAIQQKRCQEPLISVGAFYLPIEGGVDSKKLSELGREGVKLNKAKGLFDGRFVDALDTTAGSGWNRLFNFYINKDGDPYSNYKISGALKPEDFHALLNYTVEYVCKLAGDLSGGKIDITPYRLGKASPCSWCDYRSLCRFDWQVNDYNILESCDKEEALERMKGKEI